MFEFYFTIRRFTRILRANSLSEANRIIVSLFPGEQYTIVQSQKLYGAILVGPPPE